MLPAIRAWKLRFPAWVNVDSNADGIKDGYNFHFDVYALGAKTTPLFSTPVKYFSYVLNGCGIRYQLSPPSYLGNNGGINFRRINNVVIMSMGTMTECKAQAPSTVPPITYPQSTYVYGVDISATGKAPWVKSFLGAFVGTGILPDINKNGVDEFSIDIGTGHGYTSSNAGAGNISVFVYDGETGVGVATPQQ